MGKSYVGEEADRGRVKPRFRSTRLATSRRSGQTAARGQSQGQHDAEASVSSVWMEEWFMGCTFIVSMGSIPLPEALAGSES